MRKDKKEAIRLRQSGQTYNQISFSLGIPKSTLSGWFRGINFEKIKKKIYLQTQKTWSKNISQYNKNKAIKVWHNRALTQKRFENDIGNISVRELTLIGTSLYWAEGYKKTKWCISFCNSDSRMIKVMMKFFREICKIPENKFRLRIQTHPHISVIGAKKYWSKITSIPMDQFHKTQISLSKSSKSKRPINTLPFGTLHILIFDKNLVDKILGWIAGIEKI